MKKLFIGAITLTLTISVLAQNSTKEDEEAIKNVIQTAYVEGLQNEGDIDKIDSGIHPGFNLLGIGEGEKMWNLTIEDWKKKTLERKKKGEYPKAEDKKVSVKFLSIDITGTAAVAKIEFYVGKQLKYVDYISLYKFPEGWKMVNKIYYKFPEKQ